MVDDKIFEAYERLAAMAPAPDGLEERIAARARAHRQRRLLLASGVATAAVAVGVPLALRDRRSEPAPLQTTPPPAQPVQVLAPLMFTPSWFPAGVTEQYRSATFATATGPLMTMTPGALQGSERYWLPPGVRYVPGEPEPVGVRIAVSPRPRLDSGDRITVAGYPARLRRGETVAVEWRPWHASFPYVMVSVRGLPDAEAVTLRIARSVMYTSAMMTVTMRSPAVPASIGELTTAAVCPAASGWYQSLTHVSKDGRTSLEIVGQTAAPPDGVRFLVTRPDGVNLYIRDSAQPEARRMLESVELSEPDLTWVGDR
ncbi:hypothetical protein AB0M02_25625 [Actinoplanes sp. NPDC051861]|uniref:hypothetical protein n=1 Tax=Actinoplanes sp. NPDC051861 TaxID=3155170 RepID=UPI00343DFBD9